jgi:Conserved domain frequently associated with peptide methionine sulfoxide reductase
VQHKKVWYDLHSSSFPIPCKGCNGTGCNASSRRQQRPQILSFFLPSPPSSSIRISSTSLVKRTAIISATPRINNNDSRVTRGRTRHHPLFLTPVDDDNDDRGTSPALAGEQQQQQQQQLMFKERTESEWKKILSPQQYYVLREEGTERPWTSPLNNVKQDGVFLCAGCGSPLFTAYKKFEVRRRRSS